MGHSEGHSGESEPYGKMSTSHPGGQPRGGVGGRGREIQVALDQAGGLGAPEGGPLSCGPACQAAWQHQLYPAAHELPSTWWVQMDISIN